MCDPAWTSEDLARVLCDNLVAAGKLRSQPAFIREDREAKIAGIFACGSPPVPPLSLAIHPSHVSCVPGGEVSEMYLPFFALCPQIRDLLRDRGGALEAAGGAPLVSSLRHRFARRPTQRRRPC